MLAKKIMYWIARSICWLLCVVIAFDLVIVLFGLMLGHATGSLHPNVLYFSKCAAGFFLILIGWDAVTNWIGNQIKKKCYFPYGT